MSNNEQPSYYAIIPANVRYDNDLKPNEKLLYGEITCLSQSTGRCFASNEYFANLYGTSKETVSRWVSNLSKKGYVKTQLIYKEGTKQIINRYIQINQEGIDKKINSPIDEKVKDNITRVNNTSITDESLFLSFSKKYNFVEEEVFNKLVKHLSTKFKDVTKVRLTNNIKKFENCTNLFNLAVEKMIELDYSGLFIPSAKDIKDNKMVDRKPNHNVNGAEEYQF